MSGWANFANFGNSAIQGFNNYETMLAQRQHRELQANAAKAYGEAMLKMSQPQPQLTPQRWYGNAPLAPAPAPSFPQMNMPNFMQAMPKGMDPAAIGMAADRFAPIMRSNQMDEYRDAQIRLGQDRNQQGAQRIELAQARIDARDEQNAVANKFRDRALQIQALGLAQRDPQALRAFQATQAKFARANDRLTRVSQAIDNNERTGAVSQAADGVARYQARQAELQMELKAAREELSAAGYELDQYDPSGMGLPQPTVPGAAPTPRPAMAPPAMAPPAMAAPPPMTPPAPRTVQPPPAAIDDLRKNPTPKMQEYFEKQFNLDRGGARQFLQPATPQGGMPVAPGPQGGPLAPWRSPRDAQKYQDALQTDMSFQADQAARARNKRDEEAMLGRRPGQVAPGTSTPFMPAKPNFAARPEIEAEPALAPAGAPQPLGQDPEAVSAEGWGSQRSDEEIRAALAKRGVQGVDTMDPSDLRVREAMLNLVDETKPLAGLYRDAAKRTGELRAKYAPKAQDNQYIGMSTEQLNGEMKKLAAREFAARTDADKAAVKRDFDRLFKASEEMMKRRQKGS